jgi:LexA-binding, inner membrane-associated putative hydrolase
MHIPTHILSGWCIGNLVPHFTPRERLFCMIAATAADVDGLGRIVSEELYWDYHHRLGHNAFFAQLLAAAMAMTSTRGRRGVAFLMYLVLAHVHIILDYFGSGPGWPLHYLWPASEIGIVNSRAWPFFSWQNLLAAFALIAWTLVIAWRQGRTPVEMITPRLDRGFVARLRSLLAGVVGKRAAHRA